MRKIPKRPEALKQDTLQIETPEKIIFTYQIASVGTRIMAFTVDFLIQALIVILLLLLLWALSAMTGAGGNGTFSAHDANALAAAFAYIVIFFLQWGYFILFEVLFNGQSPGKKAMRIRVIRSNGEPLDFSTIVIRNLLRAIDGFPFYNFLGGLVAIVNRQSRRLGDMVTDTMVVNEIRFNLTEPSFTTSLSGQDKPADRTRRVFAAGKRLSENELLILRRFLNERTRLPADKQPVVAARLADQVMERLGLQRDQARFADPVLLLEWIYKEHTYEDDQ
jgi:uncharacterized RDD family membrane protein YckC